MTIEKCDIKGRYFIKEYRIRGVVIEYINGSQGFTLNECLTRIDTFLTTHSDVRYCEIRDCKSRKNIMTIR